METSITLQRIQEAAQFIREQAGSTAPSVGLVLGSGLGSVADAIQDPVSVDYGDVPHMVSSTAYSHEGRFILGKVGSVPVICMQGRLHSYEGYAAEEIAFPIYVMHELGAGQLFVTNAAGGIDASFEVGDLMLIEDHINMLLRNPCIGPERPGINERFFDMTQAYAPALREEALAAAKACGLALRSGVYVATPGPSFETPAEIRAFRTMGADAVGMSTVLEVIAARSCGMEVLGVSMISNPAAGVNPEPLEMDDVFIAAQRAAGNLARLLVQLLQARG